MYSYGDKTPKTVCGRIIAILWILTGQALVTLYVAQVTSELSSGIIGVKIRIYGKKVNFMRKTHCFYFNSCLFSYLIFIVIYLVIIICSFQIAAMSNSSEYRLGIKMNAKYDSGIVKHLFIYCIC